MAQKKKNAFYECVLGINLATIFALAFTIFSTKGKIFAPQCT
jgi:hypothetical protein